MPACAGDLSLVWRGGGEPPLANMSLFRRCPAAESNHTRPFRGSYALARTLVSEPVLARPPCSAVRGVPTRNCLAKGRTQIRSLLDHKDNKHFKNPRRRCVRRRRGLVVLRALRARRDEACCQKGETASKAECDHRRWQNVRNFTFALIMEKKDGVFDAFRIQTSFIPVYATHLSELVVPLGSVSDY